MLFAPYGTSERACSGLLLVLCRTNSVAQDRTRACVCVCMCEGLAEELTTVSPDDLFIITRLEDRWKYRGHFVESYATLETRGNNDAILPNDATRSVLKISIS